MIRFIARYVPILFVVGAAVASIIGMIVAVKESLLWMVALSMITFLVATVAFAFLMHSEKVRADKGRDEAIREAEVERKKREETENKLSQVASVVVAELQAALVQGNERQFLQFLRETADHVARMIAVSEKTGGTLKVRQVVQEGVALYVIARVDDDVMGLLRPGDRFVLTKISTSKVRHPVARLEVKQIGGTLKKAVAFAANDVLDSEMYDALAALAKTTEVKGLDGWIVTLDIDPQVFADVDMQMACQAIDLLQLTLTPPKETDDAD